MVKNLREPFLTFWLGKNEKELPKFQQSVHVEDQNNESTYSLLKEAIKKQAKEMWGN